MRIPWVLLLLAGCAPAARPLPNALAVLLWDAEEAEGRGDAEAAGVLCLKATRDFPEEARAWAAWGEHLRFWKGDRAGARAAFGRALSAPRGEAGARAFAHRGLGEVLRAEGDPEGALKEFGRSLDLLPLAETHRSLSALHSSRREFAQAARHARAALALAPEDPIALLQCAVQLERAGEHAQGLRLYQDAMGIAGPDPAHCCVLYNAACYLAVAGRTEEARKRLDAFLARPNRRHLPPEEIRADPDLEPLFR